MFRLPEHWSTPETFEDAIEVDGVTIHRAALATRRSASGGEATGSAADVADAPAVMDRARFELLERAAILEAMEQRDHVLLDVAGTPLGMFERGRVFLESDAPDSWRYARSNGVALHRTWEAACLAAYRELVERDRVLRAWSGETRPEVVSLSDAFLIGEGKSFVWMARAFPRSERTQLGAELEVVGAFAFPLRPGLPLAFGYAARATRHDALDAALREARQMMAFMWGEALPTAPPPLAPTAVFHLDAFQVPGQRGILRRWLDHGHAAPRAAQTSTISAEIVYVDLTPPWMAGSYRVAKAMCADAVPLAFGRGPFFPHLADELQIHPIT